MNKRHHQNPSYRASIREWLRELRLARLETSNPLSTKNFSPLVVIYGEDAPLEF